MRRGLNLIVMNPIYFSAMYPAYARSERIADATVHGFAVALSLIGTVLLIVYAAMTSGGGMTAAVAIYGALLTLSFTASTIYHFTPWEAARPVLRRIDHAAIYLKIAGTYTPLVVLMGSVFGYVVLGIVWTLALAGAVAKLFFWQNPGRFGPMLYLILGWLSLALIWSLFPVLPLAAIVLIGVGGVLYTAGVVFFNWDDLKFAMPIWHSFVLIASACFFAAITLGVAAA